MAISPAFWKGVPVFILTGYVAGSLSALIACLFLSHLHLSFLTSQMGVAFTFLCRTDVKLKYTH